MLRHSEGRMSCAKELDAALLGQEARLIEWQRRMTALPALGPDNGGQGEGDKAAYLQAELERMGGFTLTRIDAPDARAQNGLRPNLVAQRPGRHARTLWLLGHTDVVPTGELSLWKSDPWTLVEDGDLLFGRGVEDNQQALAGALLVADALSRTNIVPDLGLGLLFVADEECGNQFGLEHVLAVRPDLFGPDDIIFVPDFGVPDGSAIEVAEKGVLWLKVTVNGVQTHASRPDSGRNTLRAAARMILAVDTVAANFADQDTLFTPPCSTLTPTRHENNVPNVNTVPGRDVFYIDCRLLPCHGVDTVIAALKDAFAAIAVELGVQVDVDVVQNAPAAPATPIDSDAVQRLVQAIREVYGDLPLRFEGVGGNTLAAPFRRRGLHAVVWASLEGTCHQANERARLSKILDDARVFAAMLFDRGPTPRGA